MSLDVERMRGGIRGHCPTRGFFAIDCRIIRAIRATTPGPGTQRYLRPAHRDSPSPGALPGAAAVMEISEAKSGSCDGAASPVPRHDGEESLRDRTLATSQRPMRVRGAQRPGWQPPKRSPPYPHGARPRHLPLHSRQTNALPARERGGWAGGQKWFCATTLPLPSPHPSNKPKTLSTSTQYKRPGRIPRPGLSPTPRNTQKK